MNLQSFDPALIQAHETPEAQARLMGSLGIDYKDPRFIDTLRVNLFDQKWRINNLYTIIDEKGEEIQFNMNLPQSLLYHEMWYFNIILKARQPGITTFYCLLYLDYCLFNSNTHAVFISYNKEEVKTTFHEKIRFAYDNLPFFLKDAMPAISDTATGMRFANGSSIRVTQSGRGGTYQLVHISEYGKICAKYPQKAREIKTGTLNAVHPGMMVGIESTAEGRQGEFYDMCQQARRWADMNKKLSKLDFKFFFFPWYLNPLNVLPMDPKDLVMYDYQRKYLENLEVQERIRLSTARKAWYVAKWNVQGEDMKQEHASTPDEAFEAAIHGAYYTTQFRVVRKEGRITKVPYSEVALVDTWWDLGVDDYTVLWFTQDIGRQLHVINFYFNSGEGFMHYYDYMTDLKKEKGYRFGRNVAPHDVVARDKFRAESYLASAREVGFSFDVAPKLSILSGIQASRRLLRVAWFDEEKTAQGTDMLEAYRKQWNETTASYRDQPLHDINSHAADAWRTCATAHKFTTTYAMSLDKRMQQDRAKAKADPGGWT